MMSDKPLFIPVILGMVRKGRAGENVAKFAARNAGSVIDLLLEWSK